MLLWTTALRWSARPSALRVSAINTLPGAAPAGCRSFCFQADLAPLFALTQPEHSFRVQSTLLVHCAHMAPVPMLPQIDLSGNALMGLWGIRMQATVCKHAQYARNECSTISTSGLALQRALLASLWLQYLV